VAGHVAGLRDLGHTVEVIAAGTGDPAERAADASGAPAPSIHRVTDGGLFGTLFYDGGAPDTLERSRVRAGAAAIGFSLRLAAAVAVRARAWDAIIAHWLVPSAIAALPSAKPLLAIAHGGDIFTLRRLGLLAPVLHLLHRRDARLVFVSAQLRAIARAAAPALGTWLDAATIQSMGIDVARFAALARAPSYPPIVLVAARLVPIKGVDVAVAAMAHVTRAARLVIAGEGPERARLAAAPPGRPPAELLGQVTTARRDQLLRTASVVVIPSRTLPSGRTEGTPTIALEALAAGVPVIASAVGGLRELAAVQLVPPDDPQALGAAINRVLAAPPAAATLRSSVANLDWREVTPRLLRE
jgi:glycosyltransferase involved in cell wall biosynthesis